MIDKDSFTVKNYGLGYSSVFREMDYPKANAHVYVFISVEPVLSVLLETFAKSLGVCLSNIQYFLEGFLTCFIDCIDTVAICMSLVLGSIQGGVFFPINLKPFHYEHSIGSRTSFVNHDFDSNTKTMIPLAKTLGGISWAKKPNLNFYGGLRERCKNI